MASTNPGPASSAVLSLDGVSKRFGAVQALKKVSVECRAGEVHAVVGENGSGKSTLLGIASGILVPDEGTVEVGGQRLDVGSAADALSLGLGMAYQSLSQVLDMTVAENLYLGMPPERRPPYGDMDSWAAARLAEFGFATDPRSPSGRLSLGERQLLEVIKALLPGPQVLLLDEPTTALGPGEVERLHALVLERSSEGVGIAYVSHRLPEVLEIANRVSVLRDGRSQGTFEAAGMSEGDLVSLMIGRPFQAAFPAREGGRVGEDLALEISGLRGPRFGPIDLELHKGEILGVAGAEGNGQREFLRCLAGVDRGVGSVRCDGKTIHLGSPLGALRAGILLLSGERTAESLFPVLGIRNNSTIQVLRRFSRAGWILGRKERDTVAGLVRRLKVRTPSIEQPVRFLSGGNQQKVALTRPFLRGDLHVILADEPTQGVDVRSRFDIYEALRAKAGEGAALILKSSDPIELSGVCDRVIVFSRGLIKDVIPEAELSEKRIIEAIVGSTGQGREAAPGAEVRDEA